MNSPSALPRFPFDTPFLLDDEPAHARLRVETPVARVQLADGTPVWAALGHEAVRTVLTDPRFSRAAGTAPGAPTLTPGITSKPDNILNMDPPQHSRLRRLVAPVFTSRALELRRPRIQEITDGLLDAIAEHGPPADLVSLVAYPLPITALCDLLGMPYADIDRVAHLLDQIGVDGRTDLSPLVVAYMSELIAAKRQHPDGHLLSQLIEAHDQGDRLSEPELLQLTMGMILAGHETTANQLPNSLLTLFRHPDQLTLLRARPELVPGAVEELLRFTRLLSSVFSRTATEDVELEGVTVPAGDTVFALHYAANRDGRVYREPDRFDVTREGPPHLSFGLGPHVCLGAPLARIELQVALASLLRRFPGLELAVPESQLEWRQGNVVRAVHALPVRW